MEGKKKNGHEGQNDGFYDRGRMMKIEQEKNTKGNSFL